MEITKLKHVINNTGGLKPSLSHYFLINLENFVATNELKYYKEIMALYKFENIDKVKKFFAQFGHLVSTPIGIYVELNKALLLIDVSVDDIVGLYVHLEVFFNKDAAIDEIEKSMTDLLKPFECTEVITRVRWNFKNRDGITDISIFDINNTVTLDEAYPYIKEGLDAYIQRFIDSDETVLILIGPPGTGKTKLIRKIMRTMAEKLNSSTVKPKFNYDEYAPLDKKIFSVMYSTSQETYNEDEFFIDFVRDDCGLMVLEDIDFDLKSRLAGNAFMHKLLGASDGIIELKKKKIIITTNLQNEQQTDKALLRPGRTFDVLKTQYLNFEEAKALATKLDKPFTIEKKEHKYSLAEIYNNKIEPEYKMAFYS